MGSVSRKVYVDEVQFPAREVNELEQQVLQLRDEIDAESVHHDGESAEQAYASRISQMSLTEGNPRDGRAVITSLLFRCTVWIEIIREKCVCHTSKPSLLLY